MLQCCGPARVGCEPARRNARKINSEKEGRFPRYRGGHRRAAGQSMKAGKLGPCIGTCFQLARWMGWGDFSQMAFIGAFRVGLGKGWKALLGQRCWCSRAVAEKGRGGSCVLPEPCHRRSAQTPVPAHPAASLLLLQLARGFWQCRHVTLSPAAAILDLALHKAK